jgi:translocation and assembly module TamB
MKWKRITYILKWVGLGVAILVVFVGLLFAVVQTEWGRERLTAWISAALSQGTEVQIEFGKLEGLVPFDIRLHRLTASDPDGSWLDCRNIVLRWSPGSLIRGRLVVRELGAETVTLDRLPSSRTAGAPERRRLPSWPRGLPPVTLKGLSIGSLVLGDAVLGQRAVFRADSQMLRWAVSAP